MLYINAHVRLGRGQKKLLWEILSTPIIMTRKRITENICEKIIFEIYNVGDIVNFRYGRNEIAGKILIVNDDKGKMTNTSYIVQTSDGDIVAPVPYDCIIGRNFDADVAFE